MAGCEMCGTEKKKDEMPTREDWKLIVARGYVPAGAFDASPIEKRVVAFAKKMASGEFMLLTANGNRGADLTRQLAESRAEVVRMAALVDGFREFKRAMIKALDQR